MFYAISDIHWNINELKNVINLLSITKNDTLIFLWDYIDKWIETKQTLDYLLYLDKKYNVIFLKWNHEFIWEQYLLFWDMSRQNFLLKYWWIEALKLYSFWESYLLDNNINKLKEILKDYIFIIKKTKDFFIIKNYLLIHAWLLENQLDNNNLNISELNFFLRLDNMNLDKKYLNKYTIIAWHNANENPYIFNWYIWIDLWSAYNWEIWSFCIEKWEILSSKWRTFKS